MEELTQEKLKKELYYDPQTGQFIWRKGRNNGRVAGWKEPRPTGGERLRIKVDYKTYYASRLAWLYMTGQWPEEEVDHVNRDSLDNRWENLRAATIAQNRSNTGVRSHNKLGVKGVACTRNGKRFTARIRVHGKRVFLGTFDDVPSAQNAYTQAAKRLHGQFAG